MNTHATRHPTIGLLAGWQIYGRTNQASFLGPLLTGIRQASVERGCRLLLACGIGPHSSPVTEARPAWPEPDPGADFAPVGPWNTDGLLVINPLLAESRSRYVQRLLAAGHPLVFVGSAEGGPAISIDNSTGIRAAVAHLAAHGHRRIAFIAGNPADQEGDSGERLRAYQAALAELGLAADPELIADGYHVVDGGRQAMQRLLAAGRPFSAVLASNDESAIGALQVLRAAGVRVPGEVALIGMDDQPRALVQQPALTTLHVPAFELGYQAVELLADYMAGRRSGATQLRLPARLVIRESCGCPDARVGPPSSPPPPDSAGDHKALVGRLAAEISLAVRAGAQQLRADEADGAAEQLAAAFVAALGRRAWRPFQLALGQIVQRSGAAGDDAHAWQAALSVLRALLPGLCADDEALLDQAREALDQARVAISAEVQRQLRQRLIDEVSTTDQVGLLTARLLAALDDEQISQALETYLPGAAIGWAALGRFAPEGDDPAAWSELRLVAGDPHGLPGAAGRFRSRAFPPPELPLPGAACQLAVFPLVIEGRSEGFMAFESANLELCAAIVRQVAAAFRNVRLHRAALEGRRLAEEADRLKSHFLSMVSHELRTPLHLMIQLSGLTLDLPGEASLSRQDLARLQASARHLDSLIRDVLDLATSDVGQLTFRPELINPREALQGAALAGEQLAAAKGLAWSAALPADLPPIWVDPARLRQIALNLISNAVKFTERGAVRLEVAAGAELTISVSDTGPGVPAGEQQAIFAAFRQSDRTSGRGHGGLGLGLAICQRLAAMHGGAVSVQSPGPGGVGSVFRVALPLAQPAGAGSAPTSAEADPADAEPPAADAGLETVILIAEDEPGMRDVHVRMINAYAPEYRLLTAPDGRAALELIRRDPPDLILLDLMLPELDGFAVLEALRGEELLRSIPVIVMTAQILTEAAMARLGQGVVSVLGKGVFNAQETLAHIEAALNRKRKPGGSAQRLVRKAMAFMHARYADEGLGVADIAGHVNINEDYLARCFRQETGLTPMAYLNRYRVNQAKALLAAGAASILEVALGVGFSDSSYFSQVFRREVGMSPRTYRQRNA